MFPPPGQIARALCAGDDEVIEKWKRAVRAASASKAGLSRELRQSFVGLFGYCESAAGCGAFMGVATDQNAPSAARSVALDVLTGCKTDDARKIIESSDATDEVVIGWHFARMGDRSKTMSPRFKAAATSLSKRVRGDDLRELGVAFSGFEDAALPEFITRLGSGLDDESKAWLGIGLGKHTNPESKRIYDSACKHPIVGRDPMCSPFSFSQYGESSLAERVRWMSFDASGWLAEHPTQRSELIATLQSCLASPDARDDELAGCLGNLARVDRAAAVAVAKRMPETRDAELRTTRAALVQFPSLEAMRGQLVSWGLLSAKRGTTTTTTPVTVWDVLGEAGVLHSFDAETGQFPNEHDLLLMDLAGRAGADLEGAAFEEIPPLIVETSRGYEENGPYQLRGYLRGIMYETTAENHGDWYDVGAVLDLLNAMLRNTGSDQRLVSLATTDQIAHVMAGPTESLRAMASRGLIVFDGGGGAEAIGKGAERQVFEQLQEGQ